jgi:hypothetical protein
MDKVQKHNSFNIDLKLLRICCSRNLDSVNRWNSVFSRFIQDMTLVKVMVKFSLCLTKNQAMKRIGGVEVYLHTFLTSALDGGEWSASRPGLFTPRERDPGTH